MMKKILFPICALLLLPAGTGCEKIIEFNGEVTGSRLTLSCQAEAGEPLEACVASSVFFLSDSWDGKAFVANLDTVNGRVRCYVNGSAAATPLELVPEEERTGLCYRASGYAPSPGDHIRLEAEFPGFDPVWAETDVPREPSLEILSTVWRQMGPEDWEWIIDEASPTYEVELTLALSDDGSYDKYYFLQPVLLTADSYVRIVSFSSNDVLFQEMDGAGALESFGEAGNFFADDLISGQRHVFTIRIPMLPSKDGSAHLWLHVAAVNESLYWYSKSYARLVGDFGSFFAEGVTLYSNVHGGYGAFGAAASRWLEVDW